MNPVCIKHLSSFSEGKVCPYFVLPKQKNCSFRNDKSVYFMISLYLINTNRNLNEIGMGVLHEPSSESWHGYACLYKTENTVVEIQHIGPWPPEAKCLTWLFVQPGPWFTQNERVSLNDGEDPVLIITRIYPWVHEVLLTHSCIISTENFYS